MFYRSHGFTYLSPQEQEAYSRELCGKNTRHKIEPLRKHALMCPNDEIWANYLHAKGGFSYTERSVLPEGDVRLSVSAVNEAGALVEGLAVQLLDDDYAVVEEWVTGTSEHLTRKLPHGRYILHPAAAMKGCECAADQVIEVDPANAAEVEEAPLSVSLKVEGRALVNPVVYDWAFAMAAPSLL